ncbi:MAG: hypothetical protein WAS33_15750 [Candidatus Promineifilaceae bacterium]
MKNALKRLQRVLELEASQGYKNKAVVGGIRQFATFWVTQAREAAQTEMDKVLVEQVAEVLADYGRLPGTEARAKAIDQLQNKLQQQLPQEPTPAARKPQPASQPARPAKTAAPPPTARTRRRTRARTQQ